MTHQLFYLQDTDLKGRIGTEIRRLREAKGIKYAKDFAEMVGIDKNQISRYETGKEEPRRENLIKIADFFGLTVDYFYNLGRIAPQVRDVKDEWDVDPLKKELMIGFRELLANGERDILIALLGNIKAFLGSARASKEKREYYRFSLNIPVEVKLLDEPGPPVAIAINASQMGLLIQSSYEIPKEKEIIFELMFPKETQIQNFRAKGKVVWKNKVLIDDAEGFQYGIRFIEVLDGGHAKLDLLFKSENKGG